MRINRTLLLLLTIALLVTLTVSMVSAQMMEVPREDTVIFDVDGGNPTNPNPFNHNPFFGHSLGAAGGNVGTGQSVYEPLFILNYETGVIQPWLGESFVPDESLTVWTLTLRDGAYWQDGEAVTADDFVFTLQMLLDDDSRRLARAGDFQSWVSSVEKVDDLTAQVTLTRPNPRFQLDYFSVRIGGSFQMMPEHVWSMVENPFEFANFDLENGYPLGSGPYKMVSASENEFVYDRDDNWWGAASGTFPLPEPQRLIWVQTGNDDIRSLLTINNELDSVMDITLGAFEAIQAQNDNVIAWQAGMPFAWLDPCPRRISINHEVEPWGSADMRWALNHATSRNDVVRIAYEGTTIPSQSMFVEYGGLIDPYINRLAELGMTLNFDSDVAAAQALIEGAGYTLNDAGIYEKDGQELAIDIQTHEGFIEKRRIAENLVEQWRTAGIAATQTNVAGGTWNDNKALGNYEATGDWDQCGSVNEPWASMNRDNGVWYAPVGERVVGNNLMSRWQGEGNARYSELVDQIGVMPLGDPAILPLFEEAYEIWYNELVSLPITQAKKLIPFNTSYWEGWPTAENNFNHPATWWHSTHQIIQNLRKAGS
ncbi:MAG: ABC transporter substrate-binding protein [Anaerolineae bacterium]|nr:ABC transporter substrate-binding protein [Anaerolineae bacterium]